MDIVSALAAEEGICCTVGAGGKKTTLYALAERIERAVVTATVRIPPFAGHVAAFEVTSDPESAIDRTSRWPLGVAPAQEGPDRFAGYDPTVIDGLAASRADTILVKADGARMRKFKAPNEREPRIPDAADVVIPVVSAHVVGRPLEEELVHRVDRVADITGLTPGDELTPEAVARVIVSPHGGLKGIPPGATPIPLINMVDDDVLRERAAAVADAILGASEVPRVVLAAMREPDPLVAVTR